MMNSQKTTKPEQTQLQALQTEMQPTQCDRQHAPHDEVRDEGHNEGHDVTAFGDRVSTY
jgi:hypothetical protein